GATDRVATRPITITRRCRGASQAGRMNEASLGAVGRRGIAAILNHVLVGRWRERSDARKKSGGDYRTPAALREHHVLASSLAANRLTQT
ncbi:uncharacterized, partial [Tachysurus ichikawai]